jgi:mRNA-degrading endonuclease RelE of RelBE toxin-antitoxin system
MKSRVTPKFWKLHTRLSSDIQRRVQKAYQLWRTNPNHPSLHFKQVDEEEPIYSARVDSNYRVVGLLEEDTMLWFWIGAHDEYERLLKQL